MKRLLFNLGVFGEHGIDQAALNLLNAIPKHEYTVTLHIIYELNYESKLLQDLDSRVQIHIAIPNSSLLGKIHFYRKKSLFLKTLDGLCLFLINRKIHNSVFNLRPDYIFDYDCSLQRVINKINFYSITFIHFSPNTLRGGRKKSLNRMGNRLSSYDRIVLLCNEMLDEANALWPTLYKKFFVIPNPININKVVRKSDEFVQFPKSIDLNEFFISVGRLSEQKNYFLLIEAYKNAANMGVTWPLVIIGDGHEKTALAEKIKSFNLNQQVLLLGQKDNPYPYIKRASGFLLSSNYEGLPMVLLEAMILECPVISTNCKVGPSDILENGNLGILCEVGNVEEFTNAILTFYNDQSLRKNLKTKAKLSIKKYDASEVCFNILKLLPDKK